MAFIKCSGGGKSQFEVVIKYHKSSETTIPTGSGITSGTFGHSGKLLVSAYVYVDSGRIPTNNLAINASYNTDYYYNSSVNRVSCRMWQLDVKSGDTYAMVQDGNGSSLRLQISAFGYLIY